MPRTILQSNKKFLVLRVEDIVAWIIVAAICLVTFRYFSTAYNGQNLHVWGDEVIYRIDAMRRGFAEAYYPNYLFLWVFSLLPGANGAFPEAARACNAALFSLAVPFIYLTCNIYIKRKWSVLIAGLSMVGPLSTYSAYFMPDVMYFSGFCLFAWLCLRPTALPAYWYGALAGSSAACLCMIKPHGFFLLIAFVVSEAMFAWHSRTAIARKRVARIILASIVSFIVIRASVGWYIAGFEGLGLFGGYADKLKWEKDSFFEIFRLFCISLSGHILSIVLVTGPVIMAFVTRRKDTEFQEGEKFLKLRLFAGSLIITMFVISVLFTTKLAEGGHASETARLHMRYYNLFFPLLYLVLATHIDHAVHVPRRMWMGMIVLLVCIFSVQVGSLKYFVPLDLDAPELCGILRYTSVLGAFSALSALSVIVFAFRPREGALLFLCGALPTLLITSSVVITKDISSRAHDDIGDVAGKQISQYLGNAPNIGLFGDVTPICQVMFYAGNPSSFLYPLAEGAPVPDVPLAQNVIFGGAFSNGRKAPPELTWALVTGDRRVPKNFQLTLSGTGWRLFKMRP